MAWQPVAMPAAALSPGQRRSQEGGPGKWGGAGRGAAGPTATLASSAAGGHSWLSLTSTRRSLPHPSSSSFLPTPCSWLLKKALPPLPVQPLPSPPKDPAYPHPRRLPHATRPPASAPHRSVTMATRLCLAPAPRGEMPHPQRSSGSDQSRSHMGPSCGTCREKGRRHGGLAQHSSGAAQRSIARMAGGALPAPHDKFGGASGASASASGPSASQPAPLRCLVPTRPHAP